MILWWPWPEGWRLLVLFGAGVAAWMLAAAALTAVTWEALT